MISKYVCDDAFCIGLVKFVRLAEAIEAVRNCELCYRSGYRLFCPQISVYKRIKCAHEQTPPPNAKITRLPQVTLQSVNNGPLQVGCILSLSAPCVDGVFLLRSHQFEDRIARRDCSTIVYINLEYDATVTCWNMKEDFLCFNDPYDGITTTKVTELNKGSSIW
eukprot:TRINITY_DN3315_c0_g1_i4.p1 TRINITY_DN3315_c0_g1~~TRINITY_DN3315_c0_g1_i4.p1  ORF type:complete len:164 (+),score=10.97 TRINITY_DN3315_c0_g1_i4:438-929(+)